MGPLSRSSATFSNRTCRFFARARMASSTAGQYFSCSGVSCKAALIIPTRASVRAFRSAALGCRIPTVEVVSAALATGEANRIAAVAAIAVFLINIAYSSGWVAPWAEGGPVARSLVDLRQEDRPRPWTWWLVHRGAGD